MDSQFPEIMTEEEAERKASMIKSANEVAEAVDELKKNLEAKGWSLAEQAALTLFNTMLMTAFGEQMKNAHQDGRKKMEDVKTRIRKRAFELAVEKGFSSSGSDGDLAVINACMDLIMNNEMTKAGAVWDDYFGENTRGVLFSIATKARDEIATEDGLTGEHSD